MTRCPFALLSALCLTLALSAAGQAQASASNKGSASAADPALAALYAQLSDPSASQGQVRDAEAAIERRWREAPETGIAVLFDRAVLAMNAEEPALAAVLSGHVTALAPSWAEGWVLLGHARSALGEMPAASRAYAEAVARAPRHYRAIARLGDLALEAGDEAAALSRYREALRLNPHLSEVRARADRLADAAAPREI